MGRYELQRFFWLAVVAVLMAGPVAAMPPLAQIQAQNLAAEEILVGQVGEITPASQAGQNLYPAADPATLWLFP